MLTPLSKTENIRTLILSDQLLVLVELSHFLELCSDITLLREIPGRKRAASELAQILQPDVLLLDGTGSGGGSLTILKELKVVCPQLPLILLASQESRTYVLQAFKAGAEGYVLSMAGEVHIVSAIREVHAGHLYFCPRIRRLILGHLQRQKNYTVAAGLQRSRKNLPSNRGNTA